MPDFSHKHAYHQPWLIHALKLVDFIIWKIKYHIQWNLYPMSPNNKIYINPKVITLWLFLAFSFFLAFTMTLQEQ